MFKTFPKPKVIAFMFISIFVSVAILPACSNEEEEKPKIIDCDTVRYKGTDWILRGCQQGASSYRVDITQNNKKACFQVTCNRSGCVASVTVCSSQELSPLAPSE